MSELNSEALGKTARLVTIDTAAERLGVCRKTIYTMLEDGRLAWAQVRGRRRIVLETPSADTASESLFRTGEAARLCELSTAALRAFVRDGQVEAIRLTGSNHLRFTRSQVERLMRLLGVPLPAAWKRPTDSTRISSS